MRLRSVVVPLAAVLASAFVPGTAHAKVTKSPKKATEKFACDDGSKKSALVWWEADAKSWAVDNQCRAKWVIVDGPGASVSDPYGEALSVAPRTKFQTRTQWITSDFDDGRPDFGLAAGPLDGTGYCPVGYSLWKVGPKDHGRWNYITRCPGADELGWYDE